MASSSRTKTNVKNKSEFWSLAFEIVRSTDVRAGHQFPGGSAGKKCGRKSLSLLAHPLLCPFFQTCGQWRLAFLLSCQRLRTKEFPLYYLSPLTGLNHQKHPKIPKNIPTNTKHTPLITWYKKKFPLSYLSCSHELIESSETFQSTKGKCNKSNPIKGQLHKIRIWNPKKVYLISLPCLSFLLFSSLLMSNTDAGSAGNNCLLRLLGSFYICYCCQYWRPAFGNKVNCSNALCFSKCFPSPLLQLKHIFLR